MKRKDMVSFDTKKMSDDMAQAGATPSELSTRIGRGKDYIGSILRKGECPLAVLNEIYRELGKGGFSNHHSHRPHTRKNYSAHKEPIDKAAVDNAIKARGLQKAAVAKKLGVSPSTFSTWLIKGAAPADFIPIIYEEVGIEREAEQLELVFTEGTGAPLYTAEDITELFNEFVNSLSAYIMDSIKTFEDSLKEVH